MKLFKIIVSSSVSNNFTKRRHNRFKIRLTRAKEKASAKHAGVGVGVGERSDAGEIRQYYADLNTNLAAA